ncbi:unnamed protein product [Phytophthora fragariaefolia]|uniref:Histone-lysine N-methyltransferase, H3 lysine-79 specific n=1 Tax=Phytophthora fragariaefolia TaxID=1490495 RepID=A0A9W6Y4U9_9STRA|nr:unnamed protein product [Phytophthora fragariaefolia]
MLPTFSDAADKLLVQCAYEYARQKQRVVWSDVARKLRKHRINKSNKELETRLRTLKRAYGVDLAKFPPCFFANSRPQATQQCVSKLPSAHMLDFQATLSLLQSVFGSVTKADVRRKAGVRHENAGELLPQAVASILVAIGPVSVDDIFLDIGAGIGNVITQVALQIPVRRSIGIEIRHDLCGLGCKFISRYSHVQPLLKKVLLRNADASKCRMSSQTSFCHASIVYLNSFLFTDSAKLFVLEELFLLPRARFVISTEAYCPRHRPSCHRNSVLSGGCTKYYKDQQAGQQTLLTYTYTTASTTNIQYYHEPTSKPILVQVQLHTSQARQVRPHSRSANAHLARILNRSLYSKDVIATAAAYGVAWPPASARANVPVGTTAAHVAGSASAAPLTWQQRAP